MGKWKDKSKGKKFFIILGITVAIILILAAIPYFIIFHGGLSDQTEDWQAFSGYAAAIFGLLAVVGAFFALYHTIDHSRDATALAIETKGLAEATNTLARSAHEKYIESEERSIFFKQLELFRDTTYKMNYFTQIQSDDSYGLKAIAIFAKEIRCSIMSYYLLPYVIKNDQDEIIQNLICKYQQKDKPSDNSTISTLDTIKGRIAVINKGTEEVNVITNYLLLLRKDTHLLLTYLASIISENMDIYERKVIFELTNDFNNKNYNKVYRAYNYAGFALYNSHEAELGNYFRNVFYCLQMIKSFDDQIPGNLINKKTYNRILRAQLTRYELAILFYNYIGPKSHSETMVEYDQIDMFNNLNISDLLLHTQLYEKERMKKELVISAMSVEHKERLIAKVDKSSDTPPLYGDLYKEFIPYHYKNIDENYVLNIKDNGQ